MSGIVVSLHLFASAWRIFEIENRDGALLFTKKHNVRSHSRSGKRATKALNFDLFAALPFSIEYCRIIIV